MDFLSNCKIIKNLKNDEKKKIIKLCVYLKNEAYMVDDSDNVYHLINNSVEQVHYLCKKKVIQFAYANETFLGIFIYQMMALTSTGKIYCWGTDFYDQSMKKQKFAQMYEVSRFKYSKALFSYQRTLLAKLFYSLSASNVLCCFSLWKCLGNSIEPYTRFKMIGCGAAHRMAVTKSNKIIIWGENSLGQHANGKLTETKYPTSLKVRQRKPKEYRGLNLTLTFLIITLLIALGLCIYSCIQLSSNEYNYMDAIIFAISVQHLTFGWCLPCWYWRKNMSPHIPKSGSKLIKSIACGAYHNLVLFEDGDLYGWGCNLSGQLGRVPNYCHANPLRIFQGVVSMATVNNQTLILCKNGILKTMGDNVFSQLGNFEQLEYKDPLTLEIRFQQITTINGISLGKTEEGLFYAWGLYKSENIRKQEDLESSDTESSSSSNDNKQGEKKRKKTKKKDSKKNKTIVRRVTAHIITVPKLVRCRSFNDFITRYSDLTHFTIDVNDELNYVNGNLSSSNPNESLIDESELMVVEYVFGKSKETGRTQKGGRTIIHIGDKNKFTMFESSIVSPGGDFNMRQVGQSAYN